MQDQEMIQAFSPDASQKTFTHGIRLWSPVRRSKDFDATCCCYSCKMLPEFAISIPDQICGRLPIWSSLPQLLRDPGIGGRARHIYMHDLARFDLDDEEGKKRAAISLIKLIVSSESLGFFERALDLCFQNKRKSSRCQRRRVSGWTSKSACFQVRTILASSTRRSRSVFL